MPSLLRAMRPLMTSDELADRAGEIKLAPQNGASAEGAAKFLAESKKELETLRQEKAALEQRIAVLEAADQQQQQQQQQQ